MSMLTLDFYTSIIIGAAVFGFTVVGYLIARINKISVNDTKAQKIADAIALGARTFLREEYKVIAYVASLVTIGLLLVAGIYAALAFIFGAVLSLSTGFIGMSAATKANVRTTMAAKSSGERAAFHVAFLGGGVMGFAVASCGLFGLGVMIWLSATHAHFITLLTSFSLGASFVAFFARVGGGIYTKSADVGADLVGKLEAGIPEDDPRNPAVIADNVGDCVGDTAGMGADIYESYIGATVSSIILAITQGGGLHDVMLPVMLAVFGLIGSTCGLFATIFMRGNPAALLRNATYVAIGVFLLGSLWFMNHLGHDSALMIAIALGCFSGIAIGLMTEYYTSSGPIKRLADVSRSGAATNVIYGLSIGMESTVAPVMLLALVVMGAFVYGGGLLGVSLTAVSMLSTVGITMTVDAYGPIADNAGGIAEMAGFGPGVRSITDKLDALGNTTAAMGKGFAIGSALLTALALFSAYAEQAGLEYLNLLSPVIIAGVFIGAAMPFWISALTMRSVGDAALKMVLEVRRQFKNIAGLMEGTAEPDYERCIAISTHAALREMILPGLITAGMPVVVFLLLGREALGGFVAGATICGVLLALMMANGGGAWDNAKKYIEAGHHGGKGSDAHRAAVVGDTVGDPFKDTSGPALNILIKLISVVALLLVSL